MSQLFRNSEDGFLFYPLSTLTRLVTASVGPTNMAPDADPTGLDLDSRGWSAFDLAATLAAQSELVTNGNMSSETGWTDASTAIDANPTTSSTVTHCLMADSSTSVEDVQIIQMFASTQLPPLAYGTAFAWTD